MWIIKFMVTLALAAAVLVSMWIWRAIREGDANYLPPYWDFTEAKQEERK